MSFGISVANGLTIYPAYATSADDSTPTNPLGATVFLDDGRAYRYVKAASAVAIGQIVSPQTAVINQDVDAAASDATLTGTGDFTSANLYDDGSLWVTIDANTGIGQTRKVVSNTANVAYLDRAWTTAIDATSDYLAFGPHRVIPTAAAANEVCGVAISAMTSTYYGWVQVAGLCPMVRAAGNTDALVALEGVVASAAAGVAKGFTAGGTTADEAAGSFGYSLVAWTAADGAGTGVPVMLTGIL